MRRATVAIDVANDGHARGAIRSQRPTRHAGTMRTHSAHSAAAVIDGAIAIVIVHVAANFDDSFVDLRALECAIHTRDHPRTAIPEHSGHACVTSSGIAVIDFAIAVVIETIASFG